MTPTYDVSLRAKRLAALLANEEEEKKKVVDEKIGRKKNCNTNIIR